MTTIILVAVICSTVITSVINFAKPAYKWFAGKFTTTITVALSFILGVVAAFSIVPYFGFDLPAGAVVLIGLALGTGSNIFYDIRSLVKNAGDRLKGTQEEK